MRQELEATGREAVLVERQRTPRGATAVELRPDEF
jgi:hypothetical protein